MFKNKKIVIRWDESSVVNIKVDGQWIEHFQGFKYLGSVFTEDGRIHNDVKARIEVAKDAFSKRKELSTKVFYQEY